MPGPRQERRKQFEDQDCLVTCSIDVYTGSEFFTRYLVNIMNKTNVCTDCVCFLLLTVPPRPNQSFVSIEKVLNSGPEVEKSTKNAVFFGLVMTRDIALYTQIDYFQKLQIQLIPLSPCFPLVLNHAGSFCSHFHLDWGDFLKGHPGWKLVEKLPMNEKAGNHSSC